RGVGRNGRDHAAPGRKANGLVLQTPRIPIMVMSVSGSALRSSTSTQSAQTARPAASNPIVLGDPHPQVVVSEMAISTITMPADINAAASQLTRPGTRTGDSGTNRQVKKIAATVTRSGIQNSQCQLR